MLPIGIILILLWAAGLAFKVAGNLIHILIVVALVMFVLHFLGTGK